MILRLPIITSARRSRHPDGFDTGPRSISAVKMLRISITDRCNLRCVYCMPAGGVRWTPDGELLSVDEIIEVVRVAIGVHGIRRFKFTGGEPTLRPDLLPLVARLAGLRGVVELSMITNGTRLTALARPLRDAGLDRVTVSVDSLDPTRFKRITRAGDLTTVLRGLDALEHVGFTGTKINCVTMRGTNDDEFPTFARLTLTRPLTVRFIEYMPLGDAALQCSGFGVQGSGNRFAEEEFGPSGGCGAQDRGNVFISEREIRSRIESACGPLARLDRSTEPGVGPATVYRLSRGNPKGRIGFISAMSAPFCSTCNRLRLTANGVLRSCLFEGGEVNLRPKLCNTTDPSSRRASLAQSMADCVRLKPHVHTSHCNEPMSRIGG
jgi:cyclic pyranopterin phosphate synthase